MRGALLTFDDVTIGRAGAPAVVAPISTPLQSASLHYPPRARHISLASGMYERRPCEFFNLSKASGVVTVMDFGSSTSACRVAVELRMHRYVSSWHGDNHRTGSLTHCSILLWKYASIRVVRRQRPRNGIVLHQISEMICKKQLRPRDKAAMFSVAVSLLMTPVQGPNTSFAT